MTEQEIRLQCLVEARLAYKDHPDLLGISEIVTIAEQFCAFISTGTSAKENPSDAATF